MASVTGGNPFFLIEALRHVDESGGVWDQSTLPQGVREAVSRRLTRLPVETNKALAAAAVVGSRFAVELVERVTDQDLVDAFDEACKAGIVVEEPGGHYRFNHALVRQSLLAELPSVRRMRLHQRIATTLESEPGADDELLADLAHHYFECAWAGNAAKAVEYCRRAADQAMARLAYEGAADLYDHALHALEEIDEELPDRDDQTAELLVARCEALLAAGDMASAIDAVAQLQAATRDSARLAAWATCFDGQLSMLIHPERLDAVEGAVGAAAKKLAELSDAAGEAKAHTVRAGCLARLGRIGDSEIALDHALTAARRAREHRRVNNVLANAPLAALWGPNPVPRAGGRCLDVVRLLRITTDSPAVEATSTRCQAVLEAFRGRAAAARRMIDSARRTVSELGLRHARLEVEQFAGIVELVADDPAAAEPHLRKAYNGFRRMGLDADTAETAALLGRTCLALDRVDEADELCTESEGLAGHALKASIAWRTLRANLQSRRGDHDEARRTAEAAVDLAERTDALVDHGDACLTLATVLNAAGDTIGARAAAERAADLYERKGAGALVDKARVVLGIGDHADSPTPAPEVPSTELVNECTQVGEGVIAAVRREAWDELEQLFAHEVSVESRRKIVGFSTMQVPAGQWPSEMRRYLKAGMVRFRHEFVAVRGERLALIRLEAATADSSPGAPRDEMLQVVGLDDEGRIDRQVWFDLADVDAAIAELDVAYAALQETQPRQRRPENAASLVTERFWKHFAGGDLSATAEILADNFYNEDHRRVINSGVRRGRDAVLEDVQVGAEFRAQIIPTTVATRGTQLALSRARFSGRGNAPEGFVIETVHVIEIDADERIAALITFDPDDVDAAFKELDARYLAGEAAAHAHTWSLIAQAFAALNRHELGDVPATKPDYHILDHRLHATIPADDLTALFRATWDLTPDLYMYIEEVHRLDGVGAVITQSAYGTSQEGFDAQWRMVQLLTVTADLGKECELFDETNLDAALARFEELHPPEPRLHNAASQVVERYLAHFPARDWDAMADQLAENFWSDDRRRVVNSGMERGGRDSEIANVQLFAELGCTKITSTPIATRGERLVLAHHDFTLDDSPDSFRGEMIDVVEINADNQIASHIVFDVDDIDSAFKELDARFLAGEAADYVHTWSAIMKAHAAFNRQELPAITPDLLDHRPVVTVEAGDPTANIRGMWEFTPDLKTYVEAVYRLSNLGAVLTQASHGTSQAGFEAEWRVVELVTVEGEQVIRCELFEEADIDVALARLHELHPHERRLENAASRWMERYLPHFATRAWDAMAEMLAEDVCTDDRRSVVNAGVVRGRDIEIANLRAIADVGVENITSTAVATRGERLLLHRTSFSIPDWPEELNHEVIDVVEITDDGKGAAHVLFDCDDIDTAFEELDSRYLAGEAGAYAHTWSVVVDAFAALNRHEMPRTTPDYVIVDHQLQHTTLDPSGLAEYLRASWELTPEFRMYIEAVPRLGDAAAVITLAVHGSSQEGFDADWRINEVLTMDPVLEVGNRCEIFDAKDLDAALARFDELNAPPRRLENAASRAYEGLKACFAARDWATLGEIIADDICTDDRRRVVNAGVRKGREAVTAELSGFAEFGAKAIRSDVIATRGSRLILNRSEILGREQLGAAEVDTAVIDLIEIDADERVVARVVFDVDDIGAAFEELDARYLAGEAAAHAHTWSLVADGYAALNRRELPPTTPNWLSIDHRSLVTIQEGDLGESLRAVWEVTSQVAIHIEAVHRLNDLGAVVTHAVQGTSQEGFDAEWRLVSLLVFKGDQLGRSEVFDEADLDTALAKFDELTGPPERLQNKASQLSELFRSSLAVRDWDAMAGMLAANASNEDRRRIASAEIRLGRDSVLEDLRASVGVIGITYITCSVIATRGKNLVLFRAHLGNNDRPEEFQFDVLQVIEIDDDERITAVVTFDLDDIDAAFNELDARYLVGEAADHAQTWSIITQGLAALNRHELPPTTADFANIDHRTAAAYAPGDLVAYVLAGWDLKQDIRTHIEVVHRLNSLGAVVTHTARGTSQDGFDAEWRGVDILTVDGELISRSEVFDEDDIDTAIARFEELQPRAWRLNNAATQVGERFRAQFAARDWKALAGMFAANFCMDDRRRVVNGGVRHGRDAQIEDLQTSASIGINYLTFDVIATRGDRLMLGRGDAGNEERPGALEFDVLQVVEIDADELMTRVIMFDSDDIDAAFAELDDRYLAGEASAHAQTWSVITEVYAALNRRETPPTAPDWVDIDHRPLASIGSGDLIAYVRAATLDLTDFSVYPESVHRLTDLGAVVTHVASGISQEGFDAEWRMVCFLTHDDGLINRGEIFDEDDLDAALARFDELAVPARHLENMATRVLRRVQACLATRDWGALSELVAGDISTDDRRRVVNAGVRHGRDAEIESMRAVADLGVTLVMSSVIATRGGRLVLLRMRLSIPDQAPQSFDTESLVVVEVDADERISSYVVFDSADLEAAVAELDARYLAGEATAHAQAWSVIANAFAALNRREMPPTTPDLVGVDHRSLAPVGLGDLIAYTETSTHDLTDFSLYAESVHRLTALGAVITHVTIGASEEGFDAEWRMVGVVTLDDDRFNNCEIFDEVDLDAALARFDELSPPTTRLENAASRVYELYRECYVARDWDALAQTMAPDFFIDDRRRPVNAVIEHGRDAVIGTMRATADLGNTNVTSTVIATRGERLILTSAGFSGTDQEAEPFRTDVLSVTEINTDDRLSALVLFDLDDIDAAFAELDARYRDGEAAEHAHTWSVIVEGYAALNRHELAPITPDLVNTDHRRGVAFAPGDLVAYLRAGRDLTTDSHIYIEAVIRLSHLGVTVSHVIKGTSQEGFDAEWREIAIVAVDGEALNRLELFDEADLDVALAQFDMLSRTTRLENAASRVGERFSAYVAAPDWVAMADMVAEDMCNDDRRPVVNAGLRRGRDAEMANVRALVELGVTDTTPVVIATRGERLALSRIHISGRDRGPEAFQFDVLGMIEIDSESRIAVRTWFDPDDIAAAFAELDARYLAGEAAAHAHTWSVIAAAYAGFNRHELPATTTDCVTSTTGRSGERSEPAIWRSIRAVWDLTPDISIRVEAVHRLSNLGAVVTHAAHGLTPEGFTAEWRMIYVFTVEGDLISRCEIFDEADLDAAFARFDEQSRADVGLILPIPGKWLWQEA